ncbi:DUF1446 domain protein [Fusarium sp. NRRL 52700]|nr:DUF1446 domain protein [Fusarium sp. NRRL 52700]
MPYDKEWRAGEFGTRPVRVANCSGYHGDPAIEMYKQATLGDVDFITGDYLAEVNMANNAEAYAKGQHPGYEATALKGLELSIDTIAEKRIKVAINGGALNPEGLAVKVAALVAEKAFDLKVAYVSGDNVLPKLGKYMPQNRENALAHLDSLNDHVTLTPETYIFAKVDDEPREIVSANAYLGAHAIYEAFQQGADIIICGRASDASPVIACAWYWWSWSNTNYDELAGALVAGHLIECSAYVTGGNFAGFDAFDLDNFVDPGFPIAEIAQDGSCVITKHEGTGGMVTVDTCKSQLVYELQGDVYINSDVKAYLEDIEMDQVGRDRVRVHGVRGAPPPDTTKLALFYKGGYEMQALFNATGHNFEQKFALLEKQVRFHLGEEKLSHLDFLEFQRIGVPAVNPANQNSGTVYLRIFAQSTKVEALQAIMMAIGNISLKHYSGFHSSLDFRSAMPRPYLAYYPALWQQAKLEEKFHFVDGTGTTKSFKTTPPPRFETMEERASYDTKSPTPLGGGVLEVRLGNIALGRSGDKGANLNFGLFVDTQAKWDWLRSYMSRAKVRELLGEDWRPEFSIERVEFPKIFAVHFVVYGILGRGPDPRQRRSKVSSRNSTVDSIEAESFEGANASSTFDSVIVQTGTHPQLHVQAHDEFHSFTESSPGQTLTATDASPRDTIVGSNGDMRYFGPPSGISLVSTTTPRKSGQHTPESWSKWTHPSIEPLFTKQVMKPLPSWTEAFSLVSEFFAHEHQVFPCFNAPAFMCLLGQQYSGTCTESPAWWVSLNSVLAIAQRRRAEAAQSAEAEDLAWSYASNALAGTWDVLMRSTQLSSVQALLAIAWFFIGTPNPQPSFMLVGCAVRLAHSIGIHVESQDPSVSPAEANMRRKVFWIAICIDRELCLRTGRPPCHDLSAAYVDPPMGSVDDTEIIKTVDGHELNLFRGQIQLAMIQSAIYQGLQSGKASPNVVADSVADLLQKLDDWRAQFAPYLGGDSAGRCEHHGLMRLYFSYYNAVIVIFKTLDEAYSNTYLAQLHKVCQELYRKAHYAVQSSNSQLAGSINVEYPVLQGSSNANQQECHETQQTDNAFEFNLDAFEQTMPYPVPILWDLDSSLWTSII